MVSEDTRDKILSVANKIFSRYGFHKTSMDEIAKMARKAKGSLYYHFSSKEDLFTEVVSKEIRCIKSQLSIIVENADLSASEKNEMYLIKRMEYFNNASNYHETLKADFFEHFDFIDDVRKEFDIWERESLKKIILQGIESKDFAPIENVDVLLDMLIMTLKGLEIPFFLQGKYQHFQPHFKGLMNFLTKGLAA